MVQYKLKSLLPSRVSLLTIFGFAGAVVWLQQVTLHTATDVASVGVRACLTACPVHIAFIKIYQANDTEVRYQNGDEIKTFLHVSVHM